MAGSVSTDAGLPAWLGPELATLTRDRFSDPAWIFERKLDGERCLAFADGERVRLMTRNQNDITSTYPEIAKALAAQRRRRLRRRRGDRRVRQGRDEIRAAAAPPRRHQPVDGPAGRGAGLLLPVRRAVGRGPRRPPAAAAGAQTDPARPAVLRRPAALTPSTGTPRGSRTTGRRAPAAGRGSSPSAPTRRYRAGRTKDWLKFKCESGQEFVIGGFTDPQRSRTGFGALLLGYYDPDGRLVYAGKVGTGFTNQMLRSLHDRLAAIERPRSPFESGPLPRSLSGVHWVEPRLVGEVGFSEWTSAGELRHPRFQGLRDDKEPGEVVREIPRSAGPGS